MNNSALAKHLGPISPSTKPLPCHSLPFPQCQKQETIVEDKHRLGPPSLILRLHPFIQALPGPRILTCSSLPQPEMIPLEKKNMMLKSQVIGLKSPTEQGRHRKT